MELDTRTKAAIQVLTNQRNNAMDNVANLAAEIAGLQEELAAANKKIAELTPKEPA